MFAKVCVVATGPNYLTKPIIQDHVYICGAELAPLASSFVIGHHAMTSRPSELAACLHIYTVVYQIWLAGGGRNSFYCLGCSSCRLDNILPDSIVTSHCIPVNDKLHI